jgi:hypothetical protein
MRRYSIRLALVALFFAGSTLANAAGPGNFSPPSNGGHQGFNPGGPMSGQLPSKPGFGGFGGGFGTGLGSGGFGNGHPGGSNGGGGVVVTCGNPHGVHCG